MYLTDDKRYPLKPTFIDLHRESIQIQKIKRKSFKIEM